MRTLIYARFSSTLQNARSIEDQVALCRERCDREGWEVAEVFTDFAISGGAGIAEDQRPGLAALLRRVEARHHPAGPIEQVLVDTSSRITRNQGDGHHIRDLLNYHGCRLFTLGDGEIDRFKGAIKGLLDEQHRVELRHNIKRGQAGTVRSGRAPAGLAYGYRTANRIEDGNRIVRGLRELDEEQAAIVRRIFAEYAADLSPRAIAQRLNQEGVPAPSGGTWRASTIAGDRQRRNGMLQNRLYIGQMVVGRTSKVTDPRNRKVRIRVNPESEWIAEPVPHLRLIDDATWAAVQARRQEHQANGAYRPPRPKHMLSGMVACGCCGGNYTVATLTQWGCGKYRDGRSCGNGRTIGQHLLEARVLEGLQQRMLDPELVSAYVAEYHREHAQRSREAAKEQDVLTRRAITAQGRIDRLTRAIANDLITDTEARGQIAEARAALSSAETQLAELEAMPVVALHPHVARQYREEVANLGAALARPESRAEALPRARALIHRVVLTPKPDQARGLDIEVEGRLAALLALATGLKPAENRQHTMEMERVEGVSHYSGLIRVRC